MTEWPSHPCTQNNLGPPMSKQPKAITAMDHRHVDMSAESQLKAELKEIARPQLRLAQLCLEGIKNAEFSFRFTKDDRKFKLRYQFLGGKFVLDSNSSRRFVSNIHHLHFRQDAC